MGTIAIWRFRKQFHFYLFLLVFILNRIHLMTTPAVWTILSSIDNYAMYAEVPSNTDAAISGAGNITTATPVSISDVIISKKNQENDQLMTLTFRIVQIVCLSLILIFSVIGNSIVCLIVYQKPAMRSSINLLLANLAFSNTLFSIICIPFCIVTLATERWVFSSIGCNVIAIIYNMFTTIAVYVLLAISVDRYMIIVNRRDRLTPQRTRLIIMALWMYALVFSLPPILGWGRYSHPDGWMQCILYDPHNDTASLIYTIMQISLMFFLPVLVMVYTYTCILKIVHKNSLRIHIHSQSRDIAQLKLHGIPGMHGSQRFNINMRFKTRAFKTILLLFVAFVACWLPYSLSMTS